MKRPLSFLLFASLMTLSYAAFAECPRAKSMQMRVAKMKAIEKIDAYDIEAGEKLVDGGLLLAKGECRTSEHALMLFQLKGICRFSAKDYAGAKKAFRTLFAIRQKVPLLEKLSTPKLVQFYNGVLAQYRAELKKRADTEAKIKKLEDATGMPPEPKENPKVPLEHKPRARGLRGRKITIYCRLMDEMKATKVTLFLKGSDDNFAPLEMKKVGQRRFVLTLSGKQTSTPMLSYYLMAFNAANKPVAASGNSAKPHTVSMEIAKEVDTSESGEIKSKGQTQTKPTGEKKPKEVKQVEDDDPTEGTDPSKEEPDELRKVKTVKKITPWDEGPAPLFQISISGGMALGLVSGTSEVIEDDLATGIAPSKTLQVELGYMADRRTTYSLVLQMGWNAITDDPSYAPDDDRVDSNQYFFSSGVRNDLRFLIRYKKYSIPGNIPGLTRATGMRWRWYWGLGVGYGTVRHEVPAERGDTDFDDTSFAQGLILNGFGGVNYCFTSGCGLAAKLEMSYMATVSVEDSNYLHLDFLFGLTGTF